jgi:hypothetical protein
MALRSLPLIFLLLLLAAAPLVAPQSSSSPLPPRQNNVDFWSSSTLQSHLSKYRGYDSCLMFYEPSSEASQRLSGAFARIAEILEAGTSASSLVMVFFDCTQDDLSASLCSSLHVTKYPTVLYLSEGTPANTRAFKGSIDVPEQLRDWIISNRFLTRWDTLDGKIYGAFHAALSAAVRAVVPKSVIGLFAKEQEESVKEIGLSLENDRLDGDGAAIAGELEEAYKQSSLLLSSLLAPSSPASQTNDDVFMALHAGMLWDDASSVERNCVIDLTLDYCTRVVSSLATATPVDESMTNEEYTEVLMEKLSTQEPYCGVFELCFDVDFNSATCRPDVCPFNNNMACKYVNACMDESVLGEYRSIMGGDA